MFDSTKPAARSPLLYAMIGVCLLALSAAIYLSFFGTPRTAVPEAGGTESHATAMDGLETERTDAALRAADINPGERMAMEAVVRDYILTNPEIITQAVDILQKRDAAGRLGQVRAVLETPFPGAVAGNPNGSRLLVEFFDYACGFCRSSVPDVNRLIAQDKDLKVVFRELPILGEGSQKAARMALAAAQQGKYKVFHDAMYAAGKPTDLAIQSAARSSGLDIASAQRFAASAQATQELQKNLELARTVGFNGTPTWVTGDHVLEGAVGFDALKAAVRGSSS